MTNRIADSMNPAPQQPAGVQGQGTAWHVSLVKVPSGVAAGRIRRVLGNAQTEWWALFSTREQFDTCSAIDPLRFADPLLFAHIKREFDHAFDRANPRELHPGAREVVELCRAGT